MLQNQHLNKYVYTPEIKYLSAQNIFFESNIVNLT